jgi:F-type H+-transporting ATPase subunit gamma
MASLKDLRTRIASVKATQKITKAMQMVAAAKLRRAQEAAESARPYSKRMDAVLANITADVSGEDAPVLMKGTGKSDAHLLLVCTSERGLCGGFNSQIVRLARDHARELLSHGKQVKIMTVGKKGADILRREFSSLMIDHVDLRTVKKLGFSQANDISRKILELFDAQSYDVCTLFYSEFKSVIAQIPMKLQIIPCDLKISTGVDTAEYEYEPSAHLILEDVIARTIAVQIFCALLENAASEQGARMSAMDNATRNAGDMIKGLTLVYNRQRQAQITKELIEIISGAEAL